MMKVERFSSKFIILWLASFCFAAQAGESDDYLDRSLPAQVQVKAFEGRRYAALVPDTPDLVSHANCALNAATRLWAPEWGYEQLFWVHREVNPPILEMGHGGLLTCGPKVIETLPMLRVMTGSDYNLQEDGKIIGSLLRVTGKDGFC